MVSVRRGAGRVQAAFFRPKDLVDLQRLIAVQGPRLDTAYVRSHVAGMVGEPDERVVKWDELVAAHGDP